MLMSDFLHFNLNKAQGWAMGLGSHGIPVPGRKSRGLGLILWGLGQISLGQPNPKLWDYLGVPSWDSCPMGPIGISLDLSRHSFTLKYFGTGTKIVGTVPGFSVSGLKSQGPKPLRLAEVPY